MSVALQYTVDGPEHAPVLVLGNSLGTTPAMWEPQLSVLTKQFRVLRYDHRGHGGSPVPAGPYTIDELGGDVLALLDALELDRVHLGGVSLGGMVAMWVAAHAPQRVERLALLSTSARLGPPQTWINRIAAIRAGGMAAVADPVVGRWFTPGFAARRPETVAWARGLLTSTPADGYIACCEAIQQMDLLADLPSITAPTLVVVGADDPSTPPEHSHRIAAGIPDARTVIVPDAAHLANVEQPDAVTALLVDFLGGNDDRA